MLYDLNQPMIMDHEDLHQITIASTTVHHLVMLVLYLDEIQAIEARSSYSSGVDSFIIYPLKGTRGIEKSKHGDFCRIPNQTREVDHVHQHNNTTGSVSCELCGSRASLYCQADDAYLCRKCDQSVHVANFLALRHIRCFLCNTCQKLTQRYLIGVSAEMVLPTIVSWSERNRCNSISKTRHSRILKRPFLFL
ncbi:hypothetical protein FEM48_Zijuj04G0085900 [Ziziphus jujuba var. spinosa]|uniref:B box-type domain-containing protein n=1 Tax=Ziziphus jujuba var. spinosa TaxID=714518 RepID=A0A978VIV7_ZIZJJ|nr:hypothetical protein FEM48_Zijuj04G0085900 [Ziziphus jujuba var. spinosa]